MRASGSLVMAADSPIALLHLVFFLHFTRPVDSVHLLHVVRDSTPTETS
jgi:hypothetical protein